MTTQAIKALFPAESSPDSLVRRDGVYHWRRRAVSGSQDELWAWVREIKHRVPHAKIHGKACDKHNVRVRFTLW